MSSRTPLITIGITCYNEGDWLHECWESVLSQSDSRWTAVLVMDGGANRRTQEIFEGLSHPKLHKYAFSENVGPYPARNRAFQLTETPYHFYLDGDDQLPTDAVHAVLKAFEQHSDADYVYGNVECFGTRSRLSVKPDTFTLDDLMSGIHAADHSAYKKALWKRLDGFSDELAYGMADFDFFFKAFEAGAKGVHCGSTIYRWRVGRPDSISGSYLHTYHEKCETIIRLHPHVFSNPHRVRRFMAMGYNVSAEANYRLGRHIEARRYALQAMVHEDSAVTQRIRNHWWYLVPAWSVPVAERLFRNLKNLRSVQ